MLGATDKSGQPDAKSSSTSADDTEDESGEGVKEDASAASRRSGSPQLFEVDFDPDKGYENPEYAEMFICFATCEGYVSLRHKVNGSAFIQALCEELLAWAHLDDLYTIMTKVSGRVNKKIFPMVREDREVPARQALQTVSQGIDRKIYLLPKYPPE
ncbi:caspase-1-like [Diadema setosum]|uniref:caspase-1-like n=1 Tax=Diadema setosum TaxID=31175 RepID=UPI003B3A31C5